MKFVVNPRVLPAAMAGTPRLYFYDPDQTRRFDVNPLALEILGRFAEPHDPADLIVDLPADSRASFSAAVDELRDAGILIASDALSTENRPIEPAESMRLLGDIAKSGHSVVADLSSVAHAAAGGAPDAELTDYGDRLRRLHRDMLAFAGDIEAAARKNTSRQLDSLRQPGEELKLNLGAGFEVIEGWMSLDAQAGGTTLNLLRPLPFDDASVDFAFLAHVLEHFYFPLEAFGVLREIRRILKPGGVLRIIVPDIGQCLLAYASGDRQFFVRRDEALFGKPRNGSLLRYFLQYAGAYHGPDGQMISHKYGYDAETLTDLVKDAGFIPMPSEYMGSTFPELRIDKFSRSARAEVDGRNLSLFMDAVVPAADDPRPSRGVAPPRL